MKAMTEQSIKKSRYLTAGAPTSCFLPSCHKPFNGCCIRGDDGNFYCSHGCADIGQKIDLSKVEKLRRA
jgi:hypothetical protein